MNNFTSTIFKNLKFIDRTKSTYQDIRVFDTETMGRIMVLDNMIQITDKLEDNYTVDLTREIVKKDEKYDKILMIGAGDMYIPTYLLDNFPKV